MVVSKRGDKVGDVLGEIRYSGEFDYEKVYLIIHNWFKKMQYEVVETYKHKMTGTGTEVELGIKANRKTSEFMRYDLEVELKTWNLVEVEAVIGGKKQKINKGRLLITISFNVVLDYSSKFDKSEWNRRLFNLIRFTLWRKKIIILWTGNLVAEAYGLHTQIKKALNMETAYSAW